MDRARQEGGNWFTIGVFASQVGASGGIAIEVRFLSD